MNSKPASFADALACLQSRDLERATDICAQLVDEQPAHFDGWHLLGLIAHERQQTEVAAGHFRRSLELNPGQPAVLANLGFMYLELQRYDAALECFEQADSLQPDNIASLYGLGCALAHLKRPTEALAVLDRALALNPDMVAALNVRGHALQGLQRFPEALQSYDRAIDLQPELGITYHQRALVLMDMQQPQLALEFFDQALRRAPGLSEAHQGRGIALTRLNRLEEAAQSFANSPRTDLPYMRGQRLHALLQQADWSQRAELTADLVAAVDRGEPADEPFSFLAVSASAKAQLNCAQRYIKDWYPPREPLCSGTYMHERVRVGYLSGDFGEHPISYLMAGVFEQHERQRFEVTGFSLKPVAQSGYGARIRASFDRFVEVDELNDLGIAQVIRQAEIDILVDLMGFTRGARLGVLAHRPAPVQLQCLGYPGTMGAPYVDYILADEFVIPPELQRFYSEQVVYLPDCFQANDSKRVLPAAPSRSAAGLPESGPVFCSFNATYKITPEIFAVWCRILSAVPDSVLWLLGDRESTQGNLRSQAHGRGVSAERLVFAGRVGYAEHLARLQLADLFLDTPIFSAGASASDALWAGVPVLTCPGEAFASRMSGSLLQAVGLPELICADLAEYERKACDLELVRAAGRRLRETREKAPLFDTARFCKNLEAAYLDML